MRQWRSPRPWRVPAAHGLQEINLSARVDGGDLRFSYTIPGGKKQAVSPVLDMQQLSGEYVRGNGFTAVMVGFCCHDLRGDDAFADVEWFDYRTWRRSNHEEDPAGYPWRRPHCCPGDGGYAPPEARGDHRDCRP
ncbi:MAG: hypothetical protein IJZ74_03680 [Clostridia bacterium]|nr:hypothetical protein [Clostridia bacterium]